MIIKRKVRKKCIVVDDIEGEEQPSNNQVKEKIYKQLLKTNIYEIRKNL